MKGGKEGRKRTASTGKTPPKANPRGKPKPVAKKPNSLPPKKGSRKNTKFGGMSSSDDE
jgi:hypothetical protein